MDEQAGGNEPVQRSQTLWTVEKEEQIGRAALPVQH